jgi:CubicO group peptidase (beta-lactamase class C family)
MRRHSVILAVLLTTALWCPVVAEPPAQDNAPASALTEAQQQMLHKLLRDAVEGEHFTGACLVLVHRGTVVFEGGVGAVEAGAKRRLRPSTRVPVGPLGEPVVATALVALADRGKPVLNMPISAYLPEFKGVKLVSGDPAPRAPTLRELLGHTGGLTEMGLVRRLGEQYEHSPAGYAVAVRAAEAATGETFDDLLQRALARPLGMTDTTFSAAEGGQVTSTASDLARLLELHRTAGRRDRKVLIRDKALRTMYVSPTGAPAKQGLSFGVDRQPGGRAAVIHCVGPAGSAMWLDFERDAVGVLLVRRTGLPPNGAVPLATQVESKVAEFFPASAAVASEPIAPKTPAPATKPSARSLPEDKALQARLLRELGSAFQVHVSDHYLVVHSADEDHAKACAVWLERTHNVFFENFSKTVIHPAPLKRRLVCLIFTDAKDFVAYAKRADRATIRGGGGYYSSRTNRIAMLHTRGRGGYHGTSIIPHEAAHQLANNTGLQSQLVLYPHWLREGLATNFEPAGSGASFGPFSGTVTYHAAYLRSLHAGKSLIPLAKLAVLMDPPAGANAMAYYAQGWGLFRYLLTKQPEQMRAYLIGLARSGSGHHSPAKMLSIFEKAFGSTEKLEAPWRKYIESLPAGRTPHR